MARVGVVVVAWLKHTLYLGVPWLNAHYKGVVGARFISGRGVVDARIIPSLPLQHTL